MPKPWLVQYPAGVPAEIDTRIALMMPNLLQYPVALFGVLRAGMVVVNVNPLYTPRELEHQLNDAGELLAHCRQHLTAYKVPRIVEFRSEPLPKSNIGEILRRELRDGHAAATAQAASPPVASA